MREISIIKQLSDDYSLESSRFIDFITEESTYEVFNFFIGKWTSESSLYLPSSTTSPSDSFLWHKRIIKIYYKTFLSNFLCRNLRHSKWPFRFSMYIEDSKRYGKITDGIIIFPLSSNFEFSFTLIAPGFNNRFFQASKFSLGDDFILMEELRCRKNNLFFEDEPPSIFLRESKGFSK